MKFKGRKITAGLHLIIETYKTKFAALKQKKTRKSY